MRFTLICLINRKYALLLGAVLLFAFKGAAHNFIEVSDFGTNPGNLKMYVYKPASLKDSAKVPVVVVLHGCLQNAETVAEISGWNKLADLNGFIVLYPQQKYTNNTTGCFDWFKKKDVSKDRGEVYSIKQMIDYMPAKFNTDSKRVYVTGLSAGAAMAVALMAAYPETVKVGAIFAGGPYKVAKNAFEAMFVLWLPPNKSPKRWAKRVIKQNPDYKSEYPKLIVVHGRLDFVVNIRNSWELIQQWSYLHHTDPKPDKIENGFAKAKDVDRLSYWNKGGEEVIVFYKILGMGHALAVNPGSAPDQGGQDKMFSSDKNFHSTYWVAKDFGIVR